MSNLKGSAAANFLTGSLVILFWVIKNKCRHSECAIVSGCFTCSVKEDDDEDVESRGKVLRQKTRKFHVQAKSSVQKLHKGDNSGLFSERETVVPAHRRGERNSILGNLAEE